MSRCSASCIRTHVDEIAAFPQEGIVDFSNGENLMRKALEMGADVVGGIPNEFSEVLLVQK